VHFVHVAADSGKQQEIGIGNRLRERRFVADLKFLEGLPAAQGLAPSTTIGTPPLILVKPLEPFEISLTLLRITNDSSIMAPAIRERTYACLDP
jgi:hypothetical protein